MRIALVHYHLQAGGVTRIIENTVKSLAGHDVSTVVLTGKKPEPWWTADYRVIPGLQYELDRPPVSSAELASMMEAEAKEALGGLPDIWHVHNHSLGKNLALPGALVKLAAKGYHLLLHIHDFAEDGRPNNYHLMLEHLASGNHLKMYRQLYPLAEHIHYGVINKRDYNFLSKAGVDPLCLHRLPNPVRLSDVDFEKHKTEGRPDLWLYPTRAIRRKNIGEFLLWTALYCCDNVFATTLGPENPKEKPRYNAWKRFAKELDLPVEFELSNSSGKSFPELLQMSKGLLTTSVKEGFGLAFLEPWLVGRPVCGRDLPEITNEFREEGIKLNQLYKRLDVPVDWLNRGRIMDRVWAGFIRMLESYGRLPTAGAYDRLFQSMIQDNRVDFGCLDEELQEKIIRRAAASPGQRSEIIPTSLLCLDNYEQELTGNKDLLIKRYSLEKYGKRLFGVYQKLEACRYTNLDVLDGNVLLDRFLEPERLTLLQVE